MKKLFVLFSACVLLLLADTTMAQNPNMKWGKPSQAEWSLQAWGETPDAAAVVLCKVMNVTYTLSEQFQSYNQTGVSELNLSSIRNLGSNDEQTISMTYDVMMRTKILKPDGARCANIDIVYFNMEDDKRMCDGLGRFKVWVFSQDAKGKVKRRDVKDNTFTDERLDKNYCVRHVIVPDVKPGDIVEYQYEVSSTRVSYLYDWSFQEDIPVLYAKCEMDIPAFLQFNMSTPKHPFIKSSVEGSTIMMEQSGASMQAPKRCPSNHYVIEGHDILPKGLDLQRQDAGVEAAKVESKPAEFLRALAVLKNQNIAQPAPMPVGKSHLMIAK